MEQGVPPPLYTQWRVVRTMLASRGYIMLADKTADEYERDYCDERGAVVRSRLTQRHRHVQSRASVLVIFEAVDKVGVDVVRAWMKRAGHHGEHHLIVVLSSGTRITPPATKLLDEINRNVEFRLEVFMENEVALNVTETRGARKRQRCTATNSAAVRARYVPPATGRKDYLPTIDTTSDPVARYYGMVDGNVMNATGSSETAGLYADHRVGKYKANLTF